VKLSLSDDQLQIVHTAGDFLAAEMKAAPNRSQPESRLWAEASQLGWLCIGIPEEEGGAGFGPVEELLLFRELGRHLAPGPFLGTVAAGWLAAAEGLVELRGSLFAGARRAGLGVEGYLIDGDADSLVVETTPRGMALREVAEAHEIDSVDPSVRVSTYTAGTTVVESDDSLVRARLFTAVAGLQLGVAEAARDMSVTYARQRMQFGKAIGSFQAVKHRCADMAIRCHAAYAQAIFAAYHITLNVPLAQFHSAAAQVLANDAAVRNAADNIQNHGAIGFTEELDAGRYVRRAQILGRSLEQRLVAREVLALPRFQYEAIEAMGTTEGIQK
jgi:alkylation response protein AidB-like acyl-CoA dehydrogenase